MEVQYLRSIWAGLRKQFESLDVDERRLFFNTPKQSDGELPLLVSVSAVEESSKIFSVKEEMRALHMIVAHGQAEDGSLTTVNLSTDRSSVKVLMGHVCLREDEFKSRNGELLFTEFLSMMMKMDSVREYIAGTRSEISIIPRPEDQPHRDLALINLIRKFAEIPFIEETRETSAEYFQSCFLSHSSKDKKFASDLYFDLINRGVNCWYFPEDATMGEAVWSEISKAIDGFDRTLVVCSKNSLRSSPVLREVERALMKEDFTGGNVLFPIRIDSFLFDDWEHPRKADVLTKNVGDFSHSQASKYRKQFDKLVAALQKPNG